MTSENKYEKYAIVEKIDGALKALEQSDYEKYFELLGEVITWASKSQRESSYNALRYNYIKGEMSDRLYSLYFNAFANVLKDDIKELPINVSTHAEATQGDKIVFSPNFFKVPKQDVSEKQVCVLFDFDNPKNYACIQVACAELGFICVKADDSTKSNPFTQNIFEMIFTSQIVIADLTGNNRNVFYEIGIAHTLGKEIIHIAPKKDVENMASDIQHIHMVGYKNLYDLKGKLQLILKPFSPNSTLKNNNLQYEFDF